MTPRGVREYAEAVRGRYLAVKTRGEKGRILTEFCHVTGYHRDSAIRLLRHPPVASSRRRGRPGVYSLAVGEALRRVWEVGDRACSKRLKPFLPTLLESLEAHGEMQLGEEVRSKLLGMSSATMDRLLKPHREVSLRRPMTQGRSSSAISALVPVRTFGDWHGVGVGSLQMDLVSHCGESTQGFYLSTLVSVDVAIGWNDCRVVWGKGKERVGTAAHHAHKAMPFPVLEMHTDNGGEFLNDLLYPWCMREGIRFTRGRPYKKNDQAHVEQKNWTLVRRLVGYDRYSSKNAYEQLEKLYRPLRLYANFFQPIRKLVGKERVGSKVKKHYDEAKTPYERLLASGVLDEDRRTELEHLFGSLNPAELKRQIDCALEGLWRLAERPMDGRIAPSPSRALQNR